MAIQIRRGTDSEWESNKSNIVAGEPAVAMDTERMFIGTGSGTFMEVANIDVLADAFDSSASYVVGDFVSYHGKVYKFTSTHSGAWNASDVEEVVLADALDALGDDVYTKAETDSMLALKADASDVLSALALKADKETTYTKTEVDSALALKASASEVEDIRVGADGITYSSTGEAVRTQINHLHSSDFLNSQHFQLTADDIIQGGCNLDGSVSSKTDQIRNNGMLYVPRGTVLHVYPSTNKCLQNSVAVFDLGHTLINNYNWTTSSRSILITEDRLVVFLFRTGNGVVISPSDYDALTEVDGALVSMVRGTDARNVFNDGTISLGALVIGKYIASDGTDSASASYSATGFINVEDWDKVVIYFTATGNHAYNAFYTESFSFISGSTFVTHAGFNEITVPLGAKYVRISETSTNMASLKVYAPKFYDLDKMTDKMTDKLGNLSNLATEEKSNLVGSINEVFGTDKKTTSYSSYTQNNGVIIYDNSWYQYNNSNYKHVVIPLSAKKNILKMTAGANACYIAALKSYTKPTSSSHADPTYSDYWTKAIEIDANGYFEALIPHDANYLVLNVLYNTASCISDFELEEIAYGDSPAIRDNIENLKEISISAQNVRDFSDGTGDGCPDNLVATNLPLWKAHVSDWENTDFLVMSEWYPYFDRSQTINAYDTIFKQFFPYQLQRPATNPVRIILSKHKGLFLDLNKIANVGFSLPMMVCNLNGKSCAVVCWLQSNIDTEETRIAHYENAITALAQYDYVIVAGDFNTESGLEELETWTDAGYTLGNGGYWGTINTWENTTPNDNIVTKGFIFKKFEAGDTVTSDHKAVRAFLSYNV